jgi:hypothetical protein
MLNSDFLTCLDSGFQTFIVHYKEYATNLNSEFLMSLSVNFKSSGIRKFIAQYQQVLQHTSNFITVVINIAALKASSLVTALLFKYEILLICIGQCS